MSQPSVYPRSVDLWTLALDQTEVDPDELAAAIEREAGNGDLDFRTRLLIRDSMGALREHWGEQRAAAWLERSPVRDRIRRIAASDLGPAGFSTLTGRIMPNTRADIILQFLRELGASVQRPERMVIGGSAVLILTSALSRRTEHVDVVDEVPVGLRSQHELLNDLAQRYGIRLAHFQSHYLPTGWESRLKSLGRFGRMDVLLVDLYDVLGSKVFSARAKDRDDLRMLSPHIDKEVLAQRLRSSGAALFLEPELRQAAEKNWYIVFGESLPR